VVLLRTGTKHGKVVAACALSWLAKDAPTRVLIVEVGALPPLIALVSPSRACSDTNAFAGRNACFALRNLAADARWRELAEDHGAAGALAAAAYAPGCGWAGAARIVLRAFCPTQGEAERALGDSHLENYALRAKCDASSDCFASFASLAGPV